MDSVVASVAICSYKRPEMLAGALATLMRQEVPRHLRWEVLVIDNDPLQSARAVVEKCATEGHKPRYVNEPVPGLSQARNRAVKEARGAILAFLDDDVLVPPGWLGEMLRTFDRTGADCVGGRVLVQWDETPDDAVKAGEKQIVAFDLGERDYRLHGRTTPIGANLAIKTSLFQTETPFVSVLGRKEDSLLGAEEIELLLRLMKQGFRIWYSARAFVFHRMVGERVTTAYYIRREFWNGRSLADVDRLHRGALYCQAKAWARLAQIIITIVPRSAWARVTRNCQKHFLAACRRQKYFGYWCRSVGLSSKS